MFQPVLFLVIPDVIALENIGEEWDGKFCHDSGLVHQVTPPKTNGWHLKIDPPPEKEIPIGWFPSF